MLSNGYKSILVGLAIASFFLTIVAFYNLLPRAGIDPNIFVVLTLVAAAFVSYFFMTVFGIVKEFSLKGGSFELTSKLEEVKEDVEDTKKEVAAGFSNISSAIQSINTRVDTVITSQLTNRLDQKNQFFIDLKEAQQKTKEVEEKATKMLADVSGVSTSLPVPPPKNISPDSKRAEMNPLINNFLDIIKTISEVKSGFPGGTLLSVESQLNKAYALIIEGKYEEALRTYDVILAQEPNNTEALLRKGICLFYLGRKYNSQEYHKQSIIMYDKVLELEPRHKRALHMKGTASYYLGKTPLANEYYDKVLAIDPNFGPSLYNKACNLARLGKREETLVYLQRAIASNQRYKQWASKDEAFKALQNNPEFKKITKNDF